MPPIAIIHLIIILESALRPSEIIVYLGNAGEDAGTVTTEAADPPTPPGNKPLVTVRRRTDGAPDVTVSGGRARVLILDPGDTGPPPAG